MTETASKRDRTRGGRVSVGPHCQTDYQGPEVERAGEDNFADPDSEFDGDEDR